MTKETYGNLDDVKRRMVFCNIWQETLALCKFQVGMISEEEMKKMIEDHQQMFDSEHRSIAIAGLMGLITAGHESSESGDLVGDLLGKMCEDILKNGGDEEEDG